MTTTSSPLATFDAWVRQPRSARTFIFCLSLYLAVAANWALWIDLARIGGAPSVYLRTIGAMALLMIAGTTALLSFTAWSRFMKPLWFAVVVLAAVVQHYMLAYHIVMDPSMMANATQTDPHEVRDLLSWRMAFNVLLVVALPAFWIWRMRIKRMPLWSQGWRNLALAAVALAIGLGGAFVMNRDLAPLMRNEVHLRYMINPLAPLYSAMRVAVKPLFQRSGKLIPITAGAKLGASYAAQAKPPLFVVVVGETARADHFALNGYARNTNPELAKRDVYSFHNVYSCGTNTLASVPCMFSSLGKTAFEARKDEHENLLDVLQASGLAVFWIENQSGCKDVCNRVPNASAVTSLSAADKAALCDGDECLDDALLKGLDERLAALPPERRSKGVVLVMHQMGSHGPAYYKRSTADVKQFLPECRTNALAECGHTELVNGYDNSILYTDRFLGRTIDWLKTQSKDYDTAMLYQSDHGESLGEFGLFLHGLPYSIAPEVQKHIPLVAWFGDGMVKRQKLSSACLKDELDKPYTHDNLFHTALGVMDVLSPTYKPALDMFAACRAPAT
ncbi:phosphoethanolamine--lipid A transferase [Variovorax sp. PAMC28562]|uniref:phosphoethanolamine transferase n=1 Tax=Variovorax sp. PAMC28562 TaxID=2762323 RepID=UPI00164DB521|nr:phosphoethanolamine--lipid A transferase [Variovorax sp. PAMC28562]QNK72506.1 phosphoethanolamine--lipid A transferase [Variovorax sp. PAMC28562]